ncbi:DDE-type integrase/transposase/recombinase, partial [Arthrobacter sp. 2MCAF14]|uniref:DDE-type integrase/transposase/recombinase n=1 Tax=Arthrobacter sp. 2MCAF14 TaxID=3232982 RepID=UPI003F913371
MRTTVPEISLKQPVKLGPVPWFHLQHAVGDRSRYVYSEILPDEAKETAASFIRNPIAAFSVKGVKIQQVLTDNGSCYRSKAFARILAEAGIRHKRTRPYRPETNGKVREDLWWCCVGSSL